MHAMLKKALRSPWTAAALLMLPVAVLYGSHFLTHATGAWSTGFIQYDQAYYMANAREYQDGGTDGLRYALPFSSNYHNAPIHFQPQIALLGLLWKVTGFDPGRLFVAFGLICGLLCVRACLALLGHARERSDRGIGLPAVLFLWGGGLLVVFGLIYGIAQGLGAASAWDGAFRFDPGGGWWFLNLGRNLVLPLEAYYHLLFFGTIVLVVRQHYRSAFVVLALLAISHPFTGVGALLMLLAWSMVERWGVRSRAVPLWFPISIALILALVLVQHTVLLPQDAEHRILMDQWKLPWTEQAINFVPAYALVGSLAVIRLRSLERSRSAMGTPLGRLLLIWAVVWFALENHELFMEAHQPLHFTRGYTWSALFLLGVPALDELSAWSKQQWRGSVRIIATVVLVAVLLLDNAAWMGRQYQALYTDSASSQAFVLDRDRRDLFNALNDLGTGQPLLVAEDPNVAYLAMVYTPLRSYYSHHSNTPHAKQCREALGAFFDGRITDPILNGDLVVVAYERERPFVFAGRAERVYTNATYTVYRMSGAK